MLCTLCLSLAIPCCGFCPCPSSSLLRVPFGSCGLAQLWLELLINVFCPLASALKTPRYGGHFFFLKKQNKTTWFNCVFALSFIGLSRRLKSLRFKLPVIETGQYLYMWNCPIHVKSIRGGGITGCTGGRSRHLLSPLSPITNPIINGEYLREGVIFMT